MCLVNSAFQIVKFPLNSHKVYAWMITAVTNRKITAAGPNLQLNRFIISKKLWEIKSFKKISKNVMVRHYAVLLSRIYLSTPASRTLSGRFFFEGAKPSQSSCNFFAFA